MKEEDKQISLFKDIYYTSFQGSQAGALRNFKILQALLSTLPDREDGAHAPVCDVGPGRGGGVLHAEEVVVDVRLLRGDVVAPRGQLPSERLGIRWRLPVLEAALRLAQLLRVHGVHGVLAGQVGTSQVGTESRLREFG